MPIWHKNQDIYFVWNVILICAIFITVSLIESLQQRTTALTVKELAAMLSCSDQHIYNQVAKGKIPTLAVPGKVLFDPGDVVSFLQKKTPQTISDLRRRKRVG